MSCAAPKLIQGAYALGQRPSAVTEVYYKPREEGRVDTAMPPFHTIESCDHCRRTVRPMLCPEG